MPISAAARAMRMAISPRFAIRSVFMVIGAILTPLRLRYRWPVAWALPDAGHIVEGSTRRDSAPASGGCGLDNGPAIDISRCQEIEGREQAFGGTPDLPGPQTARRPKKCNFPLDPYEPVQFETESGSAYFWEFPYPRS